ncbi:MAG: peptide deformylase [Chloroflexota bacterium]|nr:peptide deformylase [Chloroflexota bacterium]
MTVKEIVTVDDPLIREKSKRVSHFGDRLEQLIEDMFDSMHAAQGLGLAAPQIGVLRRVFVIEMPPQVNEEGEEIASAKRYVMVNPEIVKTRGEEEMEEGCLSVPGYRGLVKRATSVVVKGQDLEGRRIRYRGQGTLAQAFQHEIDHLDGILYLDRVESFDKLWRIEATGETSD